MLQRMVGGREQLAMSPPILIELVVVDEERCCRGMGIDARGGASRPGMLNDVTHGKTRIAIARQKVLPGAHGAALVIGKPIAL